MGDRVFQVTFLVSLLVHSVLFFSLPDWQSLYKTRPSESLKITYFKYKKPIPIKRRRAVRKLPKIKKEEILKPAKPVAKKKPKVETKKKDAAAVKKIPAGGGEKSFEKVLKEEENLARKAAYISYYRSVREKIRQRADDSYPRHRDLGQGEVSLSFVVTSQGELVEVRVIDEKSAEDALLRNIAIKSIRDASPFPPFPPGMDHYQITFNVVISFE